MSGDGGGDEGGAAFFEKVDAVLCLGDKGVNATCLRVKIIDYLPLLIVMAHDYNQILISSTFTRRKVAPTINSSNCSFIRGERN